MSCTRGNSYIIKSGDTLFIIAKQQLGDGNRATPAAVTDRVGFYQHFTQMLGVDMGDSVYCDRMAHY